MWLAYVSGAFGFELQSMAALVIPLRAQELGVSLELIGLLVGAGALVPSVFSVTSGELSDRFGARRTYIGGTIVCAITSFLFVLAVEYWAMLALQLVQGFARSTAWVASQTYVGGIGTPVDRPSQMGKLSFASNAGTLAAPLIAGGAADLVGLRDSFYFLAGMCVVFLIMGILLPEVRVRAGRGAPKRDSVGGFGVAFSLMRLRGIQVALLLTFVRLWNGAGWRAFFPLFLAGLGFSPTLIGAILSSNTLVSTVTALAAGPLSRRASAEIITALALAVGALGTAISPHLATMPWVFLPSALMGTAVGLSLPLLMAIMSDDAPPSQRGVALGLRMSANQVANTLAPITMGAMITPLGIVAAFWLSTIFCWTVLVTAIWLHLLDRRTGAPSTGG